MENMIDYKFGTESTEYDKAYLPSCRMQQFKIDLKIKAPQWLEIRTIEWCNYLIEKETQSCA